MKFVLYTDHYSPHELPLFLACCEVFDEAVYVVNREWPNEASRKGWSPDLRGSPTIVLSKIEECERRSEVNRLLTKDSVLMYGSFDNPYNRIIEESPGIVIYASERWLKPKVVPGIFHLADPHFIVKAMWICDLMAKKKRYFYFPLGIHAARDMARLWGLVHGNVSCLFKAPELDFERRSGGHIAVSGSQLAVSVQRYCLDKMRLWGYFVEPSKFTDQNLKTANADDNSKHTTPNSKLRTLRVLWVGRLLKLKRVDTIIRAVGELSNSNSNLQLTLDIYGEGPEELRLKKIAAQYGDAIRFHPFVAMEAVRGLMRSHDVYVLSSNEYEGWGAVVSEALEEGMTVLCSREAGAGATILPTECLFDCGDADGLREKLLQPLPKIGIGQWSAKNAALQLKEFANGILREGNKCR
jgi:glycosyltransferase involved in cell wall biosynthesis